MLSPLLLAGQQVYKLCSSLSHLPSPLTLGGGSSALPLKQVGRAQGSSHLGVLNFVIPHENFEDALSTLRLHEILLSQRLNFLKGCWLNTHLEKIYVPQL